MKRGLNKHTATLLIVVAICVTVTLIAAFCIIAKMQRTALSVKKCVAVVEEYPMNKDGWWL